MTSALLHTEPLSHAVSCPELQISDSNSTNPALLSPPLTPISERDIPFKPIESDNISLSMKKRRLNQDHQQTESSCQTPTRIVDGTTYEDKTSGAKSTCLLRSRSMPSLDHSPKKEIQDDSLLKRNACIQNAVDGQARRWTLPSKAHPTKGLTSLKSVVKLHALNKKKDRDSSPALITLRRATLKPSRRISLTFFPPPTFSRTKSGLVSNFLKSITRSEDHTSENIDFLTREIQRDRSDRSPKLIAGNPQPSLSAMAEPLVTEILSDVSVANTALKCRRRCSTRYVSGTSIYEVIWDENDSPSNSSDYSPNADSKRTATQDSSANRRQSAAVDKLETQLFRAIAQSRRESHIPHDDDYTLRKNSFQSLISTNFSRLFNERSLQNLPRSKASRIFNKVNLTSVSTNEAIQQTFEDESQIPPRDDIEFFPPLQNHGSSGASSSSTKRALEKIDRRASLGVGRPRMGSMLGASSHVRRRSLRDDDQYKRKSSTYSNRRRSSGFVLSGATVYEETRPLLHGTTWEGENRW